MARFLGHIFCHGGSVSHAERILSWRHTGFSVHSRVLSVSFLTEHAVVDRIIGHLKLVFVAERPTPPQTAFQELLCEADPPTGFFPDPPAEHVP